MKFILFLDESGDMGIKGSDFFIITIFSINYKYIRKLDFIDKRTRRNKFKKELKGKKEIKGYYSSDKLIYHLIDQLKDLEYISYSIVMDKKDPKNKDLLKNSNKHLIYINMVKELLKNINISKDFDLRVDRFVPKNLIKTFNREIIEIFNNFAKCSNNTSKNNLNININHSPSEKWLGIQIADLIGWCCFQKFEKNNHELVEKLGKSHFIFKYK